MRRALRNAVRMLAVACLLHAAPVAAQSYGTCTVSQGDVALAATGSLTLAGQGLQGSGSGGLACGSLVVLGTSYIRVRIDGIASGLTRSGPGGGPAIPFSLHPSPSGAALQAGDTFDFSGTSLLSLFVGPGGNLPLHVRTSPTDGLHPGEYTATVSLRWYFSVCTLGVVFCTFYSESPGFARNPVVWGTGVPVTMTIRLTVNGQCAISAPPLAFGAAPFAASFLPAAGTLSVRCSAGTPYTVGLGNGQHFSAGWRRMRRGTTSDYLRYALYKGPASSARWGSAIPAERRSSGDAEGLPGVHDGITAQQFSYRGVIDPVQPTPGAGVYRDTVVVDVQF